jgi:hypothetical protein
MEHPRQGSLPQPKDGSMDEAAQRIHDASKRATTAPALDGRVKVEALRLAKLAVRDRLRSDGLRIKDHEASQNWLNFGSANIAHHSLGRPRSACSVIEAPTINGFGCAYVTLKSGGLAMIIGYGRVSTDGQTLDA